MPDGVTVAQQTLNLFVMVQIHVGQPSPISLLFACFDNLIRLLRRNTFVKIFVDHDHRGRAATGQALDKLDRIFAVPGGLQAVFRGVQTEFPAEMIWLWRDYDPAKTSQTYEMEAAEKGRPLFRVTLTSRETR